MASRQPKLKAPFAAFDLALLVLGGVGAALSIIVPLVYWGGLPEKIPTHFNIAGEPDGWGSKRTLLLLPALGVLMYALLAFMSRFPHVYNYLWKITEENAATQYRCARRLILALGAEVAWLFLYIMWGTIRVATGEAADLGVVFLVVTLAVMLGTFVIYFVNAARAR